MGSILCNLGLQVVFTFFQNRAKPWKRQLKEQVRRSNVWGMSLKVGV
jgi:hypothetical protein